VGQQVPTHDPPVARPDHPGGFDELLLPQSQHLGADDPGRVEPRDQADHDREREHAPVEEPVDRDEVEPVADRGAERDQQQEDREGHRELGRAFGPCPTSQLAIGAAMKHIPRTKSR
jgi:hypothetical protein